MTFDAADPGLTAQGYSTFMTVPSPAWAGGSIVNAPSARYGHTAVWTGEEVMVWGGSLASGLLSGLGGSYRVASDEWRLVPAFAPLTPRTGHRAVWTGQAMVIWGGFAQAAISGPARGIPLRPRAGLFCLPRTLPPGATVT